MNEAVKNLKVSVEHLKNQLSGKPEIVVVLGSGLAHFVDQVSIRERIPYAQIPGFVRPTVEGHPGELVTCDIERHSVLVFRGRFHFYEGYSLNEVVHPVRVARALGASTILQTNAAGGFADGMKPGHFMVLRDHINLTGQNPLIGPNWSEMGPRFPDMSEVYDPGLRATLKSALSQLRVPHSEGVYCGVSGPTYETPAEIEFYRRIGGHAVGMSTVPEAIAARHCGFRVAGLSCITNLASGLGDAPLHHDEVTKVARLIEGTFGQVLTDFIGQIS
jgi:purine-nucleoside phosphorylase